MQKMKKFTLSVFLFASLSFLSCSRSNSDLNPMDEINALISTPKSMEIVSANNEFAFDFFKKVYESETEENFMISPVSLSLALGMTYNGADGDTKTAFENVFKYNKSTQEINDFNKNLITKLSSSQDGSVMEIANSIWIEQNFPVKNNFIQTNQTYFDAEVQNLDFSNVNSVNTINSWVSGKTHDKIPEIITEISPDAVMFLINALYFNASWKYEFDPEDTESAVFNTGSGTKNVEMMTHTSTLAFAQNDLFTSVVLPYEQEKFSMVILLPNEGKSTDDIADELNQENWNNRQNAYDSTKIALYLPKFKLSYKNKLNDELIELGLGNAFSPTLANFSKISDISTFISFVLQKTFIDVNEEGTEAAAVTIVGIEYTSIGEGAREFNVNKPFIYLIKENLTGSICFMGKVGSPEYQD